jgi:hypothetical protein
MADGEDHGGVDLGAFVPETFKAEDGNFDVAGFRAKYDELASFKATYDESRAALPKSADEYAFAIPEDHVWPEGFDPAKLSTVDESGNVVEFNPSALLDPKDPDVAAVQAMLHELGAPAGAMSKLASVMINREVRQVMEAQAVAEAEKAKLGPEAKSRIDTIARTLNASMEAPLAKAVLDSVTSADALRGLEKLIKKAGVAPAALPAGKPDYSGLKPMDRVLAGLKQRAGA